MPYLNRRTTLKAGLAGLVLPLVPGLSGIAAAAIPASGTTARYTMTAFPYSSESQVWVYESPDATAFSLLKGPAYTPPSGLTRDPSIMRHTDGRYYLAYTSDWGSNRFGLAVSTNRVDWTFLRYVATGSGIDRSWAPEWFRDSDGSVNILVSLHRSGEASGQMRPSVMTATNSALSSWTAPQGLAGIPTAYIDGAAVKIGSTYHLAIKSTVNRSIDFATATSLAGPYTLTSTENFQDYDGEGPVMVPLDNGGWRLYFEDYHRHRFYFTDTRDTFRTWTTPELLPVLSGQVKHLTVLREDVAGGPTVSTGERSVRSVNYPDRYWAADGSLGARTSFTVVPGLADRNGFSFRAADGRYLRHYAFAIRLDAVGSGSFAEDATFTARFGSISGSVAFESYNFPGRYVRHRDFRLYVDLTSDNAQFAADSSFTVV